MGTFTQKYPGRAFEIVSECTIMPAVDNISREQLPPMVSVNSALWDTGADTTVISSKIVKALNLNPSGRAELTGINSSSQSNTYAVHLLLPTGNLASYVEVIEDDGIAYDMVIGMDVISKGDFAFTNRDGKSVFSFRLPSEEHIDFDKT